MAFETRERPCRVQGRISIKPAGSTLSTLLLLFLSDPDKLAGTLAPPSRPPNTLAAIFAGPGALSRVYTNEDVQDIICAIMKTRLATAESPCERLFKTCFLDIYRSNNHIAYYNFCQYWKDYFATAKAKGPNRIPFAVSFL